jgi:cytochrome c biogenesis protein CcmG/thiol:disulfide interchange protein DsbE
MDPALLDAEPGARRRSGRKRLVIAAGIVAPALGLLALLGYGLVSDPRDIPTPILARPAPPFALTLFDGRILQLQDLRGKVVLLNFWASWCPPCRAEARTLEAAWRRYRDVVFVGVNLQDKEEAAREFLAEFDVTYPNGMDRGARIAVDYGVWGLPETFFIDAEGRITYKHIGALGWATITAKIEEARGGVVSASQGRGDYLSIR